MGFAAAAQVESFSIAPEPPAAAAVPAFHHEGPAWAPPAAAAGPGAHPAACQCWEVNIACCMCLALSFMKEGPGPM